jgi:hypothetical protein
MAELAGAMTMWERAHAIDRTIRVSRTQARALERQKVSPVPYSRDRLFRSMARGQPVVFTDLPVPVRGERRVGSATAVVRALRESFRPNDRIRVRCGPSRSISYLTVDRLLDRWASDRARVSVTDLHIRGSGMLSRIDCSRLSDFNLLARAPDPIGREEILTMVVSSAGAFSDSHTDDPDGSNHCFTGRKLWLVWDTFEGIAHGLEDVERCNVYGDQAAFSIGRFLALGSARWFVVGPGETLFLPGHLTHKVITLERYIGVGSFFVMLPSYFRTLLRWTRHTPLWGLGLPAARRLDLVDRITERVIGTVRTLASAPREEQERWGLPQMRAEARTLARRPRRQLDRMFQGNPRSLSLISALQAR